MSLELGLSSGTTVVTQVVDLAPIRIARLYSLVVNNRGKEFAEALTVVEDQAGDSSIHASECLIEVLAISPEPTSPEFQNNSSADENIAYGLLTSTDLWDSSEVTES